jgi:benzoyl-CoA reductase subunit C
MTTLETFHNLVKSPHQFAKDWKITTGKKVVGYLCTNLPEELIYAAGLLPVRLLGSNEPEDLTKPYIFRAGFCSFARDCFAQALNGSYDYIDGVMFSVCCPHAKEVYNWLLKRMPVSFSYQLEVPMYLQNRHAKDFLISEITECRAALEKWTGRPITQANLDHAIEIYNTNRRWMKQVYDLMKSNVPLISEVEATEIALAGMMIDKETHNQMLERVLNELSGRPSQISNSPRILLLGSVNTDIELLRFIDSLGARVVKDDYCTGSRYYQTEVVPGPDRLAALADRLIEKPPCPLKDLPARRRVTHILKLAEDYRIDGVISTIQRLCDPHGLDYPAIESALSAKGLPMLKLEMDYSVPIGQFRTRIEAFLEMIQSS